MEKDKEFNITKEQALSIIEEIEEKQQEMSIISRLIMKEKQVFLMISLEGFLIGI